MNEILYILIPLVAGLLLDTLLGDPQWLPHPIRWFGNAIAAMDRKLNKGSKKQLKGSLVTVFLVLFTGALFYGLIKIISHYPYIYYTAASILVFYGLANRALIDEALEVNRKLSREGLSEGRSRLAWIVGRDTSKLSENQVRVAVLETLSENLSDGVVAPLFYYFIGGIPLMFVYKMVNTLDSMIGYKDDRYKDFGRFAARLDDVMNFIPARITALLIALAGFSRRGVVYMFRYGNKHSSPNAGYPEAALAGVLKCRFGGPNYYHGKLVNKPYIGKHEKKLSSRDISKAIIINIFVTFIFSLSGVLLLLIIGKYS